MQLHRKHRETHKLDVFSGPMISHATSKETQRQTHQLDVFSGHMISQLLRKHRDKLTNCICFQVP